MENKKKVLMIGGTGNISWPVAKTLADDAEVELYLINLDGKNDQLPADVHRLTANIVTQADYVKEKIKDMVFDSVINFVIMTEDDAKNSVDIFKGHTKQFIFISTVDVLDHRFQCLVDEEMARGNQYYSYGQNKEKAELYFMEEAEKGFPRCV